MKEPANNTSFDGFKVIQTLLRTWGKPHVLRCLLWHSLNWIIQTNIRQIMLFQRWPLTLIIWYFFTIFQMENSIYFFLLFYELIVISRHLIIYFSVLIYKVLKVISGYPIYSWRVSGTQVGFTSPGYQVCAFFTEHLIML